MPRDRGQAGFTIVEVMVAAAILMTGILGTLAMLDSANKRSRGAANRQTGVALVRDLAEAAREIPYRDVAAGTIVSQLQQNDNLRGNGSTTAWRIQRGAVTFTVSASVCAVDDPSDGTGSHVATGFCAGGKPAGTTDANPADYRIVTVTASWPGEGGTKTVEEHVLVSSAGKDRPGVETITMLSPSSPMITSQSINRATFRVTTTTTADSVVWAVDGVEQDTATGDGRTWTFAWNLPNLDGAYEVSAQATDGAGLSGESKSMTVTLNQFAPGVPEDFNAGHNGPVVEAEWSANPEGDVIGYRVYKQIKNGAIELACPLTENTECIDPAPPPEDVTQAWYWVVAVDRDPAAADREGGPSQKVDVNRNLQPQPDPPTDFTIGLDEDEEVLLSWTKSPQADSYRIYRDGVTVADRYARPDFDELDWTDPEADPEVDSHQYWITAVDDLLRESVLVGPVTLVPTSPVPTSPDPVTP